MKRGAKHILCPGRHGQKKAIRHSKKDVTAEGSVNFLSHGPDSLVSYFIFYKWHFNKYKNNWKLMLQYISFSVTIYRTMSNNHSAFTDASTLQLCCGANLFDVTEKPTTNGSRDWTWRKLLHAFVCAHVHTVINLLAHI